MAKGKSASHNRSSRTVSTKGVGVSGRHTVHQAPAKVTRTTGIVGANNSKPAAVKRGMKAGNRNAAGSAA